MSENELNLTPKTGVIAYLLSLGVSLALSVLVPLLPEGNAQTLGSYFATQIPFLLVPFFYLTLKKVPYLNVVPLKAKVKPLALLLVIPITVGAFLQNTILSVAFNWLLEALGVTPSVSLPLTDNALNTVLCVIAVVLLPALSEEFLFRGVMLSSYRQRGIIGSSLLVSVIFALSHFNLAQLVHQVILGFILAYLTASSGSVWYGVLVHLLNNVIALFIEDLIPAFSTLYVFNATSVGILVGMSLVGAIILLTSLYGFSKIGVKEELRTEGNPFKIFSKAKAPSWHSSEKKPLDYLTVGLLVFMAVLSVLSTIVTSLTL